MVRPFPPLRDIGLAVLAVVVVLWLAPGRSPASPALVDSTNRDTVAVGIVRPAPEVSFCMQGATHHLHAGDGRVLYQLASEAIDLRPYDGRVVRVVGMTEPPVEACPPLLRVSVVEPVDGPPEADEADSPGAAA